MTYAIDARPSDALALAVRTGVRIFASTEVLDRAGVEPETQVDEKLEVFREFVNSLDVDLEEGHREGPARRSRPASSAAGRPRRSSAAQPRIGSPRRIARAARNHRRSRSDQKSRTARKTTLRLGPGRRAGRARVVRHADLGHLAALEAELDQQLGREEGAARGDADRGRAPRA